jgi:hypothetical protein
MFETRSFSLFVFFVINALLSLSLTIITYGSGKQEENKKKTRKSKNYR